MRFEEFVLRVPGDEFRIHFHERLTVLAGVGAAERSALLGSLVGALTGESEGTALTCVDHTGRIFELRAEDGRVQGRFADDGSSAPVPIGWFAPDAAALRDLVVLGADDIGLPSAAVRNAADTPELAEARATLEAVTAELEAAMVAQRRVVSVTAELAAVDEQIRAADGDTARRQYAGVLADLEQVRAEAAAVKSGTRGAETDQHLLLAANEARRLSTRIAEAADSCAAAAAVLDNLPGDATDLSPSDIARLISVPDAPPADLGLLLATHQAAVDRASLLDERLRTSAAANLPVPADPRIPMLASLDQDELWGSHRAVVAAVDAVARERLALGGINDANPAEPAGPWARSVDKLETAHHRHEVAAGVLERRWVLVIGSASLAAVLALPAASIAPVLALLLLAGAVAMTAVGLGRPWFARKLAARAEAAALDEIGVPTYLSFHMRRIDAILEPDRMDRLDFAEAAVALAERSWQALAVDIDVDVAGRLEKEVRAYATSLGAQHGLVEELAELHRQMDAEALPALGETTDRLLLAVEPYGLEEDDLVTGPELISRLVHGNVALGMRARAQAHLEAFEADREKVAARLDDLLSQLGFADGPLDARAEAFDWAVRQATARQTARTAARVPELVEADLERLETEVRRLRRPEWSTVTADDATAPDATAPRERRQELLASMAEYADVVDVDRLGDRHAALQRRVASLESQRLAGSRTPMTDIVDVQQYLLAQLAKATHAGPRGEPVPVVLDDPFVLVPAERKWELMDMVARLSERTQLVYLTDDAFVGAWARRRTANGAITLLEPVD